MSGHRFSLPRSRRRKKQCFAYPQTRAIDDGHFRDDVSVIPTSGE
jgi:hypothetical protein